MGKASRWLRNLLTFKKPPKPQPPPHSDHQLKDKTRWSFVKSTKQQKRSSLDDVVLENDGDAIMAVDPDKHAIAVAAATAAVAEAAVAAAKAAAVVVKLTSSGRCHSSSFYSSGNGGPRQRWAAVVIQSAFRGYLARRALKALKALVRLQALVRGHIARKQTAEQVRQMQALLRVQARARAGRALLSESSRSSSRSSHHHPPDPQTPEKSEEVRSRSPRHNQPSALKRNTSKSERRGTIGPVSLSQEANRVSNHVMNDRVWDPLMKRCLSNDQLRDKILEVDPGNPYSTSKQKKPFQAPHHSWGSDHQSHSLTTSKDSTNCQAAPSSNPYEALPLTPINVSCELEEGSFCTAENSPRFYSASSVGGGSSRGGPFTPTKSDSFHSYLSGHSEYPSYMSYTESSKAKLRSMSAPKQRPQYERSSSTKRHSYRAASDSKSGAHRLSTSYSSFTSKAYPGSGRLDKLGMPVTRGDSYSSLYGHI